MAATRNFHHIQSRTFGELNVPLSLCIFPLQISQVLQQIANPFGLYAMDNKTTGGLTDP
jgi:hypothetical protein